uniref:phosphoglycerate mutase (2,3-diphosphoglycerate-dependent) n=1 Tax=viral metagenome TaxID=1070528 RepID=A0A6C0EPM5_9ZZZZ
MYKANLRTIKNCFLMIRHGESIWNKDSKFTGWTNIPLTNNGRKEASQVIQTLINHNLCPNIIFTSVLERSIDTSNIIKKEINKYNLDIPIYTSWRLNERHYGTLEGIPRQYVRDIYGNKFTQLIRCNFNMKPPIIRDYDYNYNYNNNNEYPIYKNCYFEKIKYGESKENVLERVLPYYENDILYTLGEDKFPLIVTHKHTARVLMKHLLRISDEDFEEFELPNKTIFFVHLNDDLTYKTHVEINY